MSVRVTTNNVPRLLIYWHDLTESEQDRYEGVPGAHNADYFRYKGAIYSVDDFMVLWSKTDLATWGNWAGYYSDTYFSGVVVRYTDEDHVVVGRYCS